LKLASRLREVEGWNNENTGAGMSRLGNSLKTQPFGLRAEAGVETARHLSKEQHRETILVGRMCHGPSW